MPPTHKTHLALPALCILMLLGGCAQHLNKGEAESASGPPATLPAVPMEEAMQFSPEDWPQALFADLYKPEPVDDPDARLPALLLVHGGGWEGRSRDDMNRTARRFSEAGYVVMNVDYRFAPRHPYPEPVKDIQLAMRWLHDNADDLSIDSDRIGMMGFSSGAHLISLAALVAGTDSALDTPHGGRELRPAAVVAGGTPSDLRKFSEGRLVEQFLGGTREQMPERYAEASPVVHVHSDAPPFFHFHGTWDRLVPPDHSADFHRDLQQAGVHSELYRMRLRGHATSLVFSGDATRAAIDFMNRQLY